MKGKKVPIFIIITMLVISSFASGAIIFKNNNENQVPIISNLNSNDLEKPVWHVNDKWIYDITELEGTIGDIGSFDLAISNFEMKVSEVQSSKYKLSVSSTSVTGSVSGTIGDLNIAGTFQNARITQGSVYIRKSDLSVRQFSGVTLKGDLVGSILTYDFTATISYEIWEEEGQVGMFPFPLNVGDSWDINLTWLEFNINLLLKNKLTGITLLDQTFQMFVEVDARSFNCVRKTTKNGYTDALEIQGDISNSQKFWISPTAGGIVQLEYNNINLGMYGGNSFDILHFTMILDSTNYEPPNQPPGPPNTPTGPTSGRAGKSYSYCTSGGDDPENNKVQYGFNWGDGSSVTWTDPVSSGAQACASHKYSSGGSFDIKAKTKDEKGDESEWSSVLPVSMEPNQAPETPSTPQGDITTALIGESLEFSTSSTDYEGDQIKYGWDLDEDGSADEWSGYYDSGEQCTSTLAWSQEGEYALKVKAKDNLGKSSGWSGTITITITNDPPVKPSTPTGKVKISTESPTEFSTSTTDPEGHKIKYGWDWNNDGTVDHWTGLLNSGDTATASNSWSETGSYQIKVIAEDEHGKQSEWSDPLSISVPKIKSLQRFEFLFKIISCFPLFEKILTLIN